MKSSFFRFFAALTAASLFCVAHAGAQDGQWYSDYNKALEQAKAENRDLLLNFTGSDWCPVCMVMEKEVFNTKTFKDYADKNLVLMRVDFPERKQLPPKIEEQNDVLQKKYSAEMFPTFVLLSKDGKYLGEQIGYLDGGPSAFIEKIDQLKK